MRTVDVLLSDLRRVGVKLTLEGDELRCLAPSGALSADDVSEMRAMRVQIIEALVTSRGAQSPGDRIVVGARPAVIPVSVAQHRLWLLDKLGLGGTAYNIGVTLRLDGTLDQQALQHALDGLVARHETLRTRLVDMGGRGVQLIDPPRRVSLTHINLIDEADPEAESVRRANRETARPFDLGRGPLLRAVLLRITPDRHRLVLTMHHVVSDGWSVMRVFFPELLELYAADIEKRAARLPKLDVQYADFALWQHARLQGSTLDHQAAYWRDQLDGAPILLDLPTDRPRPARQRFRGARVPFGVPPEVLAGLQAAAKVGGATLFMVLLSAWSVLLARWSGQSDIVIGTSVAGRNLVETENLIGFFVNTLPLRIQVAREDSFRDLLSKARLATLGAFAHQEMPFDTIVDTLGIPRNSAWQPLVQALLVLHSEAREESAGVGSLEIALEESDNGGAQTDVALHLYETSNGLQGWLHYDTDLLDAESAVRMAEHFAMVLGHAAEAPERKIAAMDVMPAAERRRVLVEWNRTEVSLPDAGCVHERIGARAARDPGRAALSFGGETLTYGELDRRANQLAHHLVEHGIGPGAIVGICLERSPWMTIAILAVLKAGGAYLPLDPQHPADRLDFMMEDAGAPMLIVDAGTAALPLATSAARIVVDRDWAEIARRPASAPQASSTPSTLAYAIYTSGSTGRPKGVLIEHAALSNRLLWMQAQYRLLPGDVVLQKTPYSFDVSVWEFLWTLSEGARLEVARPQGHLDPAYLGQTIRERGVTVIHFVPTMLAAFMNSGELAGCDDLRLVFASGEALPHALAQAFLAASPAELHNLYGPTEAAIDVTYHRVIPQSEPPVPIGRPIWNTRLFVLDEDGNPVPQGVRGELNIAGRSLARGYLGLPALTAERFVDRRVGEATERAYRTGDIVRWRNNGELEYLGRTDDQVKLRGFRIELGEIETCLRSYTGVRDAAVIAREDMPGDKRLVAYFTASGEIEPAELRAHLAAFLPDYMVPAAYVRQDRFVLTSSGKLDRSELRAPDAAALVLDAYVAPEGEVETALASIWAEVLGLPRVGRHDNFFALGGNSMLALKVLERVRANGWHSDIRNIFDAPDIFGFASTVGLAAAPIEIPPNLITPEHDRITPDLLTLIDLNQDEIDRIVSTVPGGASNIQDIYPLTPLQEGILFHHLLEEKGDTYLLWSLLSAPDRNRAVHHAAALETVMQRHDALRTSVVWEGLQKPVQVVWRKAPLQLEEVAFASEDRDIAGQLIERFNPRHFRIDLRQAPLMRGFLTQDAREDRWLLLFMVHHLVDDATSLRLLMEEVRTYLEGSSRLPQPVPFRNFVARSSSTDEEEQGAFFRGLLAGIQEPTAPFGIVDIRASGAGVSEARCEFDSALTADFRAVARAMRVSAASLFHAACGLVVGDLSGRDQALFGTVLMGRMQGGEGSDRMMGAFINTLPIRVWLGSVTVKSCVQDTHATLAGLIRHETTPLIFVQRCSEIKAPAPLFTAIVNYRRGATTLDDDHNGEVGLSEVLSEERTNYPIALIADDWDDRLVLSAQTRAPIDPERVLAMLHAALVALVQALAASPDTPMSAIDCIPAADRAQLLPSRLLDMPSDSDGRRIHELFEDWACSRPGAIAVVFGQERLTYAELNAEANRLARFLIASGVVPDQRVAICVERSSRAIVAVLAVLKAGGAYVPIEPSYPVDRIAFIFADAAPALVLTDMSTMPTLRRALASTSPIDLVLLDADTARWADLDSTDQDAPPSGAGPENLAYVIYTSGSTGKPKGVMIEHRSLVRLFTATRQCFNYSEDDVWTLFHSLAFDFSVWEIWGPLAHGGKLVLVPLECARSPEAFYDLLCSENITILNQTPSTFMNLMAAQKNSARAHAIRLIIFGGEALRPHLLRPWVERNPLDRTALINMYGITETTVHVTWSLMTQADLDDPDVSRIGAPLPDLDLYILDQTGRLAPIGVAGEIHVGGAGVARGYLNRAELTAQRFIDDPFRPGERIYRSGDIGRWRNDGELEYLGRGDNQVKLRGYRIELGEIEVCLSGHPGVREAVVLLREDAQRSKGLVAYITAAAEVDVAELRAHLAARLPDYMVPAAYVRVDRFALTANGKLDRKLLAASYDPVFAIANFAAPEGEMEIALAAIWSEVLGVDRVGRHDNFFALGGDSMLTLQVTLRARRLFRAFAVADIFEYPTLAEVCAAAITRGANVSVELRSSNVSRTLVDPERFDDAYALTTMQAIMLQEYAANGGSERGVYHAQQWVSVRHQGCSPASMERAAQHLIKARPVLRTRFVVDTRGEMAQAVLKAAHDLVDFRIHDLSMCTPEERDRTIAHAIIEDRRAPLPPADGSSGALRFVWFDCGEDAFVLLVSIHHAIDDGWGNQFFMADLFDCYLRISRGEIPALPEAINVFREFVEFEHEMRESPEAATFWRGLALPVSDASKLPQTATQAAGDAGGTVSCTRPGLVDRLYRTGRSLDLSGKAVALSAWIELLEAEVGEGGPTTVGVVSNGRSDRLSDPITALGLFWNLAPVCVPFEGDDAAGHARKVHRNLVSLEPFATYPLPKIAADRGASELFFATFNYLNLQNNYRGEAVDGMELLSFEVHDRLHYPLNLAVSLNRPENLLTATLTFDARFEVTGGRALLDAYLDLLEQRLVV